MQPVIGVTSGVRDVASIVGVGANHTVDRAYTTAVAGAGGLPLLLVPVDDPAAVLDRIDGLVLSGGGDVEPSRYGGEWHDTVYGVDPSRDDFELALVEEARARRLPTLAICRGMQVLNVALGGSLIVDIPSQVDGALGHSRVGEHARERHQPVSVDAGCRLAAVVGRSVAVNSIHHQAVDRLGRGLRVVARAPDGIVEGLEHEDAGWPLWAVQWHPEFLAERHDEAGALFGALVEAARGPAQAGSPRISASRRGRRPA